MSKQADQQIDWLRLIRTENIGPVTFYKLLERFGSAANALEGAVELSSKGGKKIKPLAKDKAVEEIEKLNQLGGEIITRLDEDYPPLLGSIYDAPPVISVIGNKSLLAKRAIAIVGARNASLNGQKIAKQLASEIGKGGFLISSGMARGVDRAAHIGALKTGTVAVVGGGVDVVYPRENNDIYEKLVRDGAVISEVPFGTKPQAMHFPRRNRIISGMSRGTVVVEAGMKSGSLITARMALEQGREVFAVPGSPLDPRSAGANRLIREGAQLTENAQDIFNALETMPTARVELSFEENNQLKYKDNLSPNDQAGDEAKTHDKVLNLLSPDPVSVDEIIRSCQCSPAAVSMVLLELELAGRLMRHPGGRVALIG
ncbi:MAG: DNA-processing protein DprA [Rhodospirillaceae bacterium]|nr:DNA-processing protein DprA [Rhodospirillaceae bacterium]